jgi:diguanylate cyclase (GGDEF)-like protein/PAS domain S-box-containing protein
MPSANNSESSVFSRYRDRLLTKWTGPTPSVPGAAIALVSVLLGSIVGIQVHSWLPTHHNSSFLFGSYPSSIAAFGIVIMVVIALVILKSKADRRYEMERDLLDAFLEHIPDNVFFKNRESRFLRISRAMANYCGLAEPAQAINKTDLDIFSSEHAEKALADEREIIRSGQPAIGIEEKETWPDGRESWVLTTKVPLKDRNGQIIGTMGISHNITDRKIAELKIQHMALHDALTGLPNRILLEDRLVQATALARRHGKRVVVLMLDLDRFKNMNDSFGHYFGDRLLKEVAMRLKARLRASDIFARLAGDEFVIAIPMVGDSDDVELVAQRVLSSVAEPFCIEGHDLRIGASIGICEYPADADNAESLLQFADTAMYEAKKRGRGRYCFFARELADAIRRRQSLDNDLHQAGARGEFTLHYQPIVLTASGLISGVESLLRWNHPIHGLISPAQFIPQLEEMGLMVEVGNWALQAACQQIVQWQKEMGRTFRMAVNLSAQQFYRGDIVTAVKDVLRETGLDPGRLELELTESLTLDVSENTIRIMNDLKQIGVSLSLDDFGTGWSSLSYLSRFPLDRIKIDRSFLRDIGSQPAAEAVIKSILNLGRSLGLDCVGEGVESFHQLDFLAEQKCAEVQGFLFSRALEAPDCSVLLRLGRLDPRAVDGRVRSPFPQNISPAKIVG